MSPAGSLIYSEAKAVSFRIVSVSPETGAWGDYGRMLIAAAQNMATRGICVDIAASLRGAKEPNAMPYVIYRGEEPVGMAVVTIGDVGLGEKAFWIEGLYLRPGSDGALEVFNRAVRQDARRMGFDKILFGSSRPGMQRLARRYGAKPWSMIYQMDAQAEPAAPMGVNDV